MKVFISHSWKNKTAVQKIADALTEAGMDVWLDAKDIVPGQSIPNTIKEVLKGIDIVVLVWSKETKESTFVSDEISACWELNKIIIPFMLDGTTLENVPNLQWVKGIQFQDFADGVGRLKMVLLYYMTQHFNMQGSDAIKAMNAFVGTLEVANHLAHKEDIKNTGSEADKDYWVDRIETTENAAAEKIGAEMQRLNEIKSFLDIQMEELGKNLDNKTVVGNILQQIKGHVHASHPTLQTFIARVQKMYDSF